MLPAGVVLLALALAWANRSITDDAFIYFRYAEHLATGIGLAWNAGERVDGATNFLWTLCLAAAMAVGVEPVAAAFALGLACTLLALALYHTLARHVLGSRLHALAATTLLGTNYTFSQAATQGLGTHLETATLLGVATLLVDGVARARRAPARFATVSLCAAAAVLTRLDALVALGPLLLAALALAPRRPSHVGALVLPGGLVVGTWLAWRWSYFGALLPNTFHVKVGGPEALPAGLYYLYAFVVSYLLVPHLALATAMLTRVRIAREWPVVVSVAIVASWAAYVARIGGDFIEYRFLAPVLPYLLLWVYWAALRGIPHPTARALVLASLALGSLHHQLAFGRTIFANCVHRPSLAFLTGPAPASREPTLWAERETGRYLRRAFGPDANVRIAVGAAGAIPFDSKLPAVDLMGLNDAFVARHGIPIRFARFVGGVWPGHVRTAALDYLVRRGVHLHLGAGALARIDLATSIRTVSDLVTTMYLGDPALARQLGVRRADFPPGARVFEIPVRPSHALLAVALTPHPAVESAATAGGWRSYPVEELGDG